MTQKVHRRSFGSLTTSIKGKKYICRWTENTERGRRRKSRTIHGSRREAELFLSRKQLECSDEKPMPTVDYVFQRFAAPWYEKNIAESTFKNYMRIYQKHIKPKWGECCLDKVKPLDMQTWLSGFSKNNGNQLLVVLKRIFKIAEKYYPMERNPMSVNYDLEETMNKRISTIYTFKQACAAFDHLHGSDIEAAFIIACFGGSRSGESIGVRASEVELVEKDGLKLAVFDTVRQMPAAGDEPLPDGKLKTKQSVRTSVVPGKFGVRLHEIAQERIASGYEWLTVRPDGRPYNRTLLNRRWKSSMEDAPVEYIPFQNLRNSWRTFMQYEMKVSQTLLERLMGHTQKDTSGKYYIRPSRKQVVFAAMNELRIFKDIN